MKSLVVIKKELLQQLRDYKMLLIMTLLPIIIIMVMGLIFNANDTADITLDELTIGYHSENDNLLSNALIQSLHEMSQALQIKPLSKQEGYIGVENNELAVFIVIESKSLELYKNDTFYREGSALESYIDMFITRYALIEDVGLIDQGDYSSLNIISGSHENNILNYFGIAMCLLFVFYGMPMQITSVMRERKNGTFTRMLSSPTPWHEILFGKVIGNILLASLQVSVVMIVTLMVFQVNWGNPLLSWLLLESFVVLSVAIGIVIGFIFKTEDKAMGFIHILIVFMAFFGGSYMPLENIGWLGTIGKFFSPIWWTNTGLFAYIYYQDMFYYLSALAINMGFTVLLIGLSSYLLTKRNEVTYA